MSRLKNATEVTVLSVLVSHKNALSGCVKDGPFVMLQKHMRPIFLANQKQAVFQTCALSWAQSPRFLFYESEYA